MKVRLLIRIVIVVSIVLLCTGFGVYSFLRMDTLEKRQDFNLYTLIPQDAIAVLETDRMAELVDDINRLSCSKDNHFLYISELFVYLKNYLHTLVGATPHGLSRQMNKMLISFHAPDTPLNQVLYCALGAGDYELLESFVRKYTLDTTSFKRFDYKGEEILIYPMADGRFLAAYITPDFFAISFQKRLIEEVIDAYRSKKSLMEYTSFRTMHAERGRTVAASVYVRMKEIGMGKDTSDTSSQSRLGSWAEFDMKFSEDAIYCSGVSSGADTIVTFVNALRNQQPLEGFAGERLPVSTFFYNQWAVSDMEPVFEFAARQRYAVIDSSDYIRMRDEEWMNYLKEYAEGDIMSCLFLPKDTASKQQPCAVMSISLKNEMQAEQRLKNLLYTIPKEEGIRLLPPSPDYKHYPRARKQTIYVLPRNSMLTRLTGITGYALHAYACFYQRTLLFAPDVQSLVAYVDAIEAGEVLEGNELYETSVGSLSPIYNFAMMVDMDEMLKQPDSYVRLVPNFFFRHSRFFRYFTLAIQFTCVNEVVHPNIVLLYKGE